METLYSSWNPGEQYHLTTLSEGGISSSSTSNHHHHQLNLTSPSSLSSSPPSSSSSSSSSPSSSSKTVAALMAATSYLVGCDTPPTPVNCDSVMFNNQNQNINGNMFYSPIGDNPSIVNQGNNINYEYQQPVNCNYNEVMPSDYYNGSTLTNGQTNFLSHQHHNTTNYSIPTSMESPANTSYSTPSPSPDLWENYGLTENVKHLNQSIDCNNLDHQQSHHHNLNHHLLQQQHHQHQHHHHHHQQQQEQQHDSIVTNYHNQQSTQQQVQQQNNLDNNKSTYTINDNLITTANNNNTTINTISNNNKDISVNVKNTINPINKSTNHRGSYKNKKSLIDTNLIKNESNLNQMNENVSHNHPKTSNTHRNHHHHHHHRSIESRGGGLDKYLTPEDEERRRRRRERNKVAATKCRNKKKVHVHKLCQESHTLESTNCSLKEEMENLKREEQRLNEILVKHLPFCVRRTLQPIQ